ncbi:Uncharacterized protein BM_BM2253 [Brugia malayi]|uniref:Hypothetical 15.4 kDa protein C16C10.11 in chromosome III, putative n=1 Tax=Brugia malayi TaxID=6279 RepID=A0A4E9F5L8_BRUMA|nr:Uncharacterized protein BM_BM2253 [Brugia malayi]VIO91224.1 Uncharacterized protein BM_BM2253 [Brugia malayi]
MSTKPSETAVLRPSLKRQSTQAQARSKESDDKRHVTFATPKLPSFKCNLPKQQQTFNQSISKPRKQKSVVDVHRKRIPSVQLAELRAKKNRHNEQIAQEALVRLDYVIRRLGREAKEQEAAATTLLQSAISLIEIDVLRSFEKQRIGNLLDSVGQQQHKVVQELREEFVGFNEKIAGIGKMLVAVKKYNEMLDMQFASAENEGDLSVVEEMKLLSADVRLYLDILDSLQKFHL